MILHFYPINFEWYSSCDFVIKTNFVWFGLYYSSFDKIVQVLTFSLPAGVFIVPICPSSLREKYGTGKCIQGTAKGFS